MRTETRRALRASERCYWIAELTSPTNVMARVRLGGHLTAGLVERAATALAAEHPMLRVSITADADGGNPAFTPTAESIPIRRVAGDDLEWEREAERELGTALDWQRGPLVRIVDIALNSPEETHDLLLTVSHIIGDALTAMSLLHRLIEYTGELCSTADDDPTGASRPPTGTTEDLLPARYRGIRAMAVFGATGLADLLAMTMARPSRLAPEANVAPGQRRTRITRRTLTSNQVDTLMRRCRAEGVTVHGALTAAMLLAIGPSAAQRDSGRVSLGTTINVRAELSPPVPNDAVGVYVSIIQSILPFGGRHDLWSVARRVNRSISRRRRVGQHLALIYAMRFIFPGSITMGARVFGLSERHGPTNICITNVGAYAFPGQIGDWQLSGAQLFCSVSQGLLAMVNTSHDRLFWNFLSVRDVVSDRSAQTFADDCVATLLRAID
jgi:NRPS condensation-like uncharacterized protein